MIVLPREVEGIGVPETAAAGDSARIADRGAVAVFQAHVNPAAGHLLEARTLSEHIHATGLK